MKHWTENDFDEWLYGLKEPDSHLQTCHECRAEMERLTLARQRVLAGPEVSEEFLAAQRRTIYSRLQQASRNFAPLRWAVSITMLLVVVISLTLPRSKTTTVTLTNDEQLFSDLAAIEQTDEPKAIQPLHKLFEE
jgi:predicted anti-sigma-YlaC factor YlaD